MSADCKFDNTTLTFDATGTTWDCIGALFKVKARTVDGLLIATARSEVQLFTAAAVDGTLGAATKSERLSHTGAAAEGSGTIVNIEEHE